MAPKKRPKISLDEQKIIEIMRTEQGSYESVGRSTEFQVFKRIMIDGLTTDYITCSSCNDSKLIKYDTRLGSSAVNGHLSKDYHLKVPKNDQPLIGQHLVKSVAMKDRQQVFDDMALWCAIDNRPFNIVEGDGFKSVIRSIVKVTAKYGMINVNEIIPCKQTSRVRQLYY